MGRPAPGTVRTETVSGGHVSILVCSVPPRVVSPPTAAFQRTHHPDGYYGPADTARQRVADIAWTEGSCRAACAWHAQGAGPGFGVSRAPRGIARVAERRSGPCPQEAKRSRADGHWGYAPYGRGGDSPPTLRGSGASMRTVGALAASAA